MELQLRIGLSFGYFLSAVLTLVVTVAIFSLLPESVAQAAGQVNYTPSLPPGLALSYPSSSALLLYLVGLVWTLREISQASQHETPELLSAAGTAGVVAGITSFGTLVIVFLVNRSFALSGYFLAGGTLSLILGATALLTGIALGRRARQAQETLAPLPPSRVFLIFIYPVVTLVILAWLDSAFPDLEWLAIGFVLVAGVGFILLLIRIQKDRPVMESQPHSFLIFQPENTRRYLLPFSVGVALAMFIPSFGGIIQASLTLVLIPVQMIGVLANYGAQATHMTPDFTMPELVQGLYQTQTYSTAVGFVSTVLVSVVLVLVIGWIVRRFIER